MTSPDHYTLCNRWAPRRPMSRCDIGALPPPFARAALVITVRTGQARAPQLRPTHYYRSGPLGGWASSRSQITPTGNSVWVIATRHPRAARAAVQEWAAYAPADTASATGLGNAPAD